MENNWIGSLIQLIVVGTAAYLVVDFVKPMLSKGATVESNAGQLYDHYYKLSRSQGLDHHQASSRAYREVSSRLHMQNDDQNRLDVNQDGGYYYG